MRCMMYEITVFVNLRFRPLIRKQEASGLKKKLHSKDRFRKAAFLSKNAQHVWTGPKPVAFYHSRCRCYRRFLSFLLHPDLAQVWY